MRTVLALVAAAAMIAGALMFRDRGDGPPAILGANEPATLYCITELKAVCDELAGDDLRVIVQEAGETADELSGSKPPDADGWLTLAPWPGIVDDRRERAARPGLSSGEPVVLARSPLVMTARQERTAALDRACSPDWSWRCVGDHAGDAWSTAGGEAAWGEVKPGFTDPSLTGTGLLILGQIGTDFVGRPDFSTRDMDKPSFADRLIQLHQGAPETGTGQNSPVRRQVLVPASFDIVGTTEAEAAPLLESSKARAGTLAIRYPQPLAVAEVVLAPLRDVDAYEDLAEQIPEAAPALLAREGWRVEGQQSAPGVPAQPALPEDATLPKADVLEALRLRWEEIAR